MINTAMAIKTKASGEATMLVSKCLEILAVIDVQRGNIGDGLVYGKHALYIRRGLYRDPRHREILR